jgi:hypothetical protein
LLKNHYFHLNVLLNNANYMLNDKYSLARN